MILRLSIILFCGTVLFGSASLFVQEYRVVFLLRGTTNDQIAAFANPNYKAAAAVSARTLRDLIIACARLSLSAPALKAQPELAETVRGRCAELADEVLQTSPANARARALAALMSPKLSAPELAVAQSTAPYEPWPLVTRLSAIAAADTAATEGLAPDIQSLAQTDFARALQSGWGQREVVKIYTQNSALRPLIQGALGGLTPVEQSRFIRLVRQAAASSR
jgi:hypothetical protein